MAIQEKMRYYDNIKKSEGKIEFDGRHYYENLCMRTLNQAVGRALRHAKDYACIVIVDPRITSL